MKKRIHTLQEDTLYEIKKKKKVKVNLKKYLWI